MDSSNEKEILIQKFSNKILGIRNYKSSKKEFAVSDFINLEVLKDFLDEVSNGESDITPAGKVFLEKYFGFDELATMLEQRNTFSVSLTSQQKETSDWLKQLIPMETMTFIEKVRGNITDTTPLRQDLLPPEID